MPPRGHLSSAHHGRERVRRPVAPARREYDLVADVCGLYARGFRTFFVIALIVHAPVIASVGWLPDASQNLPTALSVVVPFTLYLLVMIPGLAGVCYAAWGLCHDQPADLHDIWARVRELVWPSYRLAILLVALAVGLFIVSLPVFAPINGRLNELSRSLALQGIERRPIGTEILLGLATEIGGLALATFLLTPGSLAVPALVTEEDTSAMAALKRSLTLVREAWWRIAVGVAAILAVVYLLPITVSALAAAITVQVPASTPGRLFEYTSPLPGLAWLLSELFAWPVAGIGLTRLYYERVS